MSSKKSLSGELSDPLSDPRQWTMDSAEWTIKNSDQILIRFCICWELNQNETFCILQNKNFSFHSTTLQKDTLHIGLNLGRILHSIQILIVLKSPQKVKI